MPRSPTWQDLGGLLQRAKFALPVVDADRITVTYPDALALMRELRAMGAANALRAAPPHSAAPATLQRVVEIYQERFGLPDGRVPATFEIVTLTAWAPHESQQQPLRPGTAKARLADALGTTEQPAGDAATRRCRAAADGYLPCMASASLVAGAVPAAGVASRRAI